MVLRTMHVEFFPAYGIALAVVSAGAYGTGISQQSGNSNCCMQDELKQMRLQVAAMKGSSREGRVSFNG